MAIAINPPNRPLTQDITTGVPPRADPIHPKITSAKLTAATTTPILTLWSPMKEAASKGTIAPRENATADARAACIGLGNCSLSFSS
ncbi:hypothetical protein HanPSC8_Chr11g0468021 [Helianthus annuus]|nr:hypothetical protein HanPSC8_Chr11g0468021 [Helianthus annuus]